MKSTVSCVSLALLTLALLAMPAFTVRAEEKAGKEGAKVAVKDLPKSVTDAVTAAMPGGTITDAEKMTKDGKTTYALNVTKDGKKFAVVVDDAAKVISCKEAKAGEGEKK